MFRNYIWLNLLIVLSTSTSVAQSEDPQQRYISVYGTGTIELPADQAALKFSVKDFGSTLNEAVAKTRRRVSELNTGLQTLGLSDTALYTSYFMSGDNFEGKAFLSSSRNYRALIEVRVTIDSLPLLEGIIEMLTKSKLEKLSEVTFSLRNDSEIKLECRKLAVDNAKVKAAAMAGELGVRLGEIISIEEMISPGDGDFYIPSGISHLRAGPLVDGGVFFPQRFRIRAGVQVRYELAKND